MVTSDGYTMEPGITIPSDAINITVSANGTYLCSGRNPAPVEVGTIQLARFQSSGLNSVGRNLFFRLRIRRGTGRRSG